MQATKSKRCVFYEKYAENHYTEFLSAYNESWTIAVSKKGKMRPGYKARRGQRNAQFIERASRSSFKQKMSVSHSIMGSVTISNNSYVPIEQEKEMRTRRNREKCHTLDTVQSRGNAKQRLSGRRKK